MSRVGVGSLGLAIIDGSQSSSVTGVLLVVVGIMVYTNYFLVLNSWVLSLTKDWLLRRL